jgi:PAS domain S-box-containing protein
MYIFDVETLAFLEVNEAMVQHYGYSRQELLGMTLKDIRPPEDVPALLDDLAGISEPQDVSGEWRHLKKDGTLIHVFIATHAVEFNNKQARHVLANDITNLKVAENELRQAEAYYRALIEKAPDGIGLLNENFYLKFASPSAKRMFGFELNETELIDPRLYTHPDDLEKVELMLNEIVRDPSQIKTIEYRFRTKNNEWRWIASTFRNLLHVPEVRAIIINFRDITDRKLIENEKDRLSGIIESSLNEIYIFNVETLRFEYMNQGALKKLGYTREEMSNFYPWDIAPSFNKETIHALIQPLINGKESLITFETFQKRKNGGLYPVEVRLQLLSQSNNALFFGIVTDISERKQAAESLVRSEEKFRKLFVTHAAIKLIVDPESLDILDANHAASAFYGWSIEELKSMNMSEVNTLPVEKIKGFVSEIQDKKNVFYEFRHRLKNGSVRDVEVFSSIIQVEEEKLIHTIVHDVTAKKEAQQRLNVLTRSLEQSPVGVIITNNDGVIEYTNPKYSDITGYSPDEMHNTVPGILQKNTGSKLINRIWEIISSGREWFGENEDITKRGSSYWENVAISPVFNDQGEIKNFVIIKEDITDQKKLLHELVLAKEAAEESDRLKSAFLANMSHEIRTPMNGILGFMELLKEPDLTGEMRDEYIGIVNTSGQRLLETINDIIDISKIESGELELNLSKVDVIKMMQRLGQFFEPEARKKKLELMLETNIPQEQCTLLLDSHKTESVLTNLLKNAIKFTAQGQIVLGCNINGKHLSFYVRDTGRGIAADKLSSIFDRFVQAESSYSRAYEGSGLGLSISKAYVELMGGTVSVDSEPGKGSHFMITIPMEKDCMQVAKVVPNSKDKVDGLYNAEFVLLIAEDDDISFLLMKRLFKNYNVRLLRAINGQEAVEISQANPEISLVLMDIKMPVMDGHTATREIHKIRPGLPVIALTAYALKEDREKALDSGCIDYLSKPVSRQLLLQKLAKYVGFKP